MQPTYSLSRKRLGWHTHKRLQFLLFYWKTVNENIFLFNKSKRLQVIPHWPLICKSRYRFTIPPNFFICPTKSKMWRIKTKQKKKRQKHNTLNVFSFCFIHLFKLQYFFCSSFFPKCIWNKYEFIEREMMHRTDKKRKCKS